MLMKFEQNRMVQTTRNFAFFDQKKIGFLKNIFDKALTPFWKTFLQLKQLMLNYTFVDYHLLVFQKLQ